MAVAGGRGRAVAVASSGWPWPGRGRGRGRSGRQLKKAIVLHASGGVPGHENIES